MADGQGELGDKLTDFIDLLASDERWPQLERAVRRLTHTVADEWGKRAPAVKLDVVGLIKEMRSAPAIAEFTNLFAGNYRYIAMLAEMNRRSAVETHDFVDEMMPKAVFNPNQMLVIENHKQEIMQLGGSILDLGVYKGGSTRALARIFPNETINGFDSFEGLPDGWMHYPKGTFGDVRGVLPNMPDNVRLYKGWFDETLPQWLEQNKDKPISLLRIDCDIYSSTKTIFDVLGGLVKSGTWIVFDELIGYRGFKDHEYKAFREFQDRTGIMFEYVSFGTAYSLGYVK